jgi:hypothetical protein
MALPLRLGRSGRIKPQASGFFAAELAPNSAEIDPPALFVGAQPE